MNPALEEIRKQASRLAGTAVELRRRIHARPEIGLETPETRQAVLDALAGLELDIETSQCTSGVVATLRGTRPGPTLLLRADMDALPMREDTGLPFASEDPETMHACGHDAHVAMLAGAARLLAERRDALAGTVKLLFQPGEEGYAGARRMIEEGLLEAEPRPDAAFAIHVDPRLAVGRVAARGGAIAASADVVSIDVRGRGGHASMPHDANDPVPVACEMVQALQTFITRRIDAFDPVVLTFGRIHAGTASNIIPETANLLGTLRTVSEGARGRAHAGIRRVAQGVASAHEMEVDVHLAAGYPVTVNDAGFVRFTEELTGSLLGVDAFIEMRTPMMGAEDFSYVLQRVPGAIVFLGARPDGVESPAPCHSNRMVLNEAALEVGIALHAAVALEYLGSPRA